VWPIAESWWPKAEMIPVWTKAESRWPKADHAMKAKYQTLDDCLEDLDAIKHKVAEQTRGMTANEVVTYFAGAKQRLLQKLRRPKRKVSSAKR
jgi:cell fate (sporulation/competence/biofilm development) regulator YlbF (YheA/YmcA/DUF963 family)